jgi:Aminoglycoside-2''-adenylyltransferase
VSGSSFGDVRRIAWLMRDYPLPWGVCGGWAVDLFVGRVSRPHKDVDIAILRRDQLDIQTYLRERGWSMEIADKGTLTPWIDGGPIERPRHGIWCRNHDHNPDFLEVLLNEREGSRFLFRRDRKLTLSLDRAFLMTSVGVPILAPEIVLLYKSVDPSASERDSDFQTALPKLEAAQRGWLATGLTSNGTDHPWLAKL